MKLLSARGAVLPVSSPGGIGCAICLHFLHYRISMNGSVWKIHAVEYTS